MTQDLTHIRGIIWDLDGTLYRFSELFRTACNHAAARSALAMRPDMVYEDAYQKSVLSEEQNGFSLLWFHQETNIPFEDMHFIYHDAIDESVIEKNASMIEALRPITLPQIILTNASRGWVTRILKQLGLDEFFNDENILALEDANFTPKGRGTAGFELAIRKLGLPANDVLMVEDLPRNLAKAKECGLATALVHHGKIPDGAKAHVDHLFADTIELMKALTAAKA